MSIINEMLNNLARQRKRLTPTQQILNDLNPIHIRAWSYQKMILLSLVFVLFFLSIIYASLDHKTSSNHSKKINNPTNAIPLPAPNQTPVTETPTVKNQPSYVLPVNIPDTAPILEAENTSAPANVHTATLRPFTLEETARVELEKAVKLGEGDQTRDAIDILENLLEKFPKFQEARQELVRDLMILDEMSVAESILTEGLQYTPNYSPFIELRAQISLKQNNPRKALKILLTSPPKLKENPEYHAMIAAVYEKLEEPTRAMNIYRQLIQLQPENALWWFGLAVTLEEMGQPNAAAQAYKTSLSSGDLNPELQAYATTKINTISG